MGALLLTSAGCSQLGYLTHVSVGQVRVLLARERLTPERAARLTPREREGLSHLEDAREHAESLGLGRSTSFRHLIERPSERALQILTAAPADRLEPLTWWFPVVGRVSYRGYFEQERAQAFRAGLTRRGFDTYLRPALLYSTLGFFDDPIPRALLSWDELDVLLTVVHELVHEAIFVAGDTAYNEGLASFIAHHGALEYFAKHPQIITREQDRFADDRRFAELLGTLAAELSELYGSGAAAEEIQRRRALVFARYRDEVYASLPWRTPRYDGFREAPLSNAYVLANQAYIGDLPCFELELVGLGGDIRRFVLRHREDPGRRQPSADCAALEGAGGPPQ